MDKIDEICWNRKRDHAKLQSFGSKVYDAFLNLEAATFSDGALSRRVKELIVVSISVRDDCEPCIQWHIDQAASAGATMREVLEAMEVGVEMAGWRYAPR
jgi:AhpD family alkylhydroperoxidase